MGYYAGVMVSYFRRCLQEILHGFSLNTQEFTRQAISLFTVMFWSRLSDHIGRKPILLLGPFALAISMISFGLSSVFWALVVRYDGILHLIFMPG